MHRCKDYSSASTARNIGKGDDFACDGSTLAIVEFCIFTRATGAGTAFQMPDRNDLGTKNKIYPEIKTSFWYRIGVVMRAVPTSYCTFNNDLPVSL